MSAKKIALFFASFLLLFFVGVNYSYAEEDSSTNFDLSVYSITVSPSNLMTNQDCVIKVTAKNTGTSTLRTSTGIISVSAGFPDFYRDESIYPQINSDNRVAPGEYFYYEFHGKFTSRGKKTLSFQIDGSDQANEIDEDNNTKTKEIEIYPPEDLDIGIDVISLSNLKPIVDENISITVKIKNTGKVSLVDDKGFLTEKKVIVPVVEKEIEYSFKDFDLSGVEYNEYPSEDNPFDPGEIIVYTYKGSFNSAGAKSLSFQANTNNRLNESNISNDSKEVSVTVYEDEEARDTFSINDLVVNFLSSTKAIVSWNTEKETSGKIEYKRSHFTSFTDEIKSSTNKKEHSMTLEGLLAGETYACRITSSYGSVTQTTDKLFTMPKTDDLLAVSGPTVTIDNELKKAAINWSTNLLSNGYVYYGKDGAEFKNQGSDSLAISHEVIISGLEYGKYSYYIKSTSDVDSVYQSNQTSFEIEAPDSNTAVTQPVSQNSNTSSNIENTNITVNTQAVSIKNGSLYSSLKGKIILKVEANGEAYYINPSSQSMHYLGRPDDAFNVMREQGVGITNANLEKIQIGFKSLTGVDSDGDGLSDIFEDAIGTDKNNQDSDGDGYSDCDEIKDGYNPHSSSKLVIDNTFSSAQKGKIFLQVEGNGEAWYVNPADGKRYFLGRPADAFNVMRYLGLGISNSNFSSL